MKTNRRRILYACMLIDTNIPKVSGTDHLPFSDVLWAHHAMLYLCLVFVPNCISSHRLLIILLGDSSFSMSRRDRTSSLSVFTLFKLRKMNMQCKNFTRSTNFIFFKEIKLALNWHKENLN
jgi:hypothetical protein